ncbi:hypothetical protein [Nocardia terpenica]|uniref:Uncharacterized protein n=1 Tax=Nocardia terpenica TaxID=455432 RepID=A0A291RG54_9NOCA|nr:hypothetical protein [Nocardia terpenica]ATL66563.1 hypothetical protein CRH09_10440 [Nocardia terpenica]
MAYTHAFESLQELATSTKPSAIGLVRKDVSGPDAPRHAVEVQRHAHSLGYQYLYTVVRHEALFSGSEVRDL